MSVRRAQQEIDASEYSEWLAFDSIDPFGEQRADLRHGIACALTANAWKDRKGPAFKPEDFMPFAEKPRRKKLSLTEKIVAMNAAMGGEVRHGHDR